MIALAPGLLPVPVDHSCLPAFDVMTRLPSFCMVNLAAREVKAFPASRVVPAGIREPPVTPSIDSLPVKPVKSAPVFFPNQPTTVLSALRLHRSGTPSPFTSPEDPISG
ncbi:hypothetical protein ACFQ2B_11685 [Streptomyces stramineus]